ncbi:unnamed protein product [Moneuplotes crassus]|uniref:Regulatory protein SIR2 homolog 7 n=1 Tax=Euplotes crassus TaxID=5936 RepID=A0AAD1XIF2_EUPCR|nr:unnamed protein product [Moneuplotes crassus]
METYATKITGLARLIRSCKKPIIFTGAGLSTNAGIPDYRSGMDTTVKTGPGIWNYKDDDSFWDRVLESRKRTLLATPSYSHMAIAKLIEEGLVEHLISQNVDGLHVKSRVPLSKLTELHGNVFSESCQKCGSVYYRNFRTRIQEDRTHDTGKTCDNAACGGDLHDTLVLFGESIPRSKLELSLYKAYHSELCVCIGSSLLVKPAVSFPMLVKKRGKLAILNMDPTPLDKISDVTIHDNCDTIMKSLMDELGITVPDYIQENRIDILKGDDSLEVIPQDLNHRKIKHVELLIYDEKSDMTTEKLPYRFKFSSETSQCQLRLHFKTGSKTPLEIDFEISQLSHGLNPVICKFTPSHHPKSPSPRPWTEIKFQ